MKSELSKKGSEDVREEVAGGGKKKGSGQWAGSLREAGSGDGYAIKAVTI